MHVYDIHVVGTVVLQYYASRVKKGGQTWMNKQYCAKWNKGLSALSWVKSFITLAIQLDDWRTMVVISLALGQR